MALPRTLTSALETLTRAVDQLEATAAGHAAADRRGTTERELTRLRSRCDELLRANNDVDAKLEQVATALRSIAAERASAPPPIVD